MKRPGHVPDAFAGGNIGAAQRTYLLPPPATADVSPVPLWLCLRCHRTIHGEMQTPSCLCAIGICVEWSPARADEEADADGLALFAEEWDAHAAWRPWAAQPNLVGKHVSKLLASSGLCVSGPC